MCPVVSSFINNMPWWHEPSIWSMTVYREEVRRGLVDLYSPSLALSTSYFSTSARLQFTIHGIRVSWKCVRDRGLPLFLFILNPNTHTHTHTRLHPWLPPFLLTHFPFSHAPTPLLPHPSHLLSLNNRCSCKIKEEYAHACVFVNHVVKGKQPHTYHQLRHAHTNTCTGTERSLVQ